jgi:hypothetical protein
VSASLRERVRINATLRCTTKGCTKLRVLGRVVPYCAICAKRHQKFGDPRQHFVSKKRLERFHPMAKRFMRQHASDEAMLAALVTMQELLNLAEEPEPDSRLPKKGALLGSASRGPKNPEWLVWREFYRLRHPRSRSSRKGVRRGVGEASAVIPQHAVRAEEALTAALTVWIGNEILREGLFVNDGAPLTYALADAVLRLRQLETNGHDAIPIAASTKKTVGQRLRDELGVFFMRAIEAIRVEEQARAARKAVLRQPIVPKLRPENAQRNEQDSQKGKPQRNGTSQRSFAHFLATDGA